MTKRAAFTYGMDGEPQKHWRSLDEYAGSPEFQQTLANEFPEGHTDVLDPVSRRSFIGLMGASLGLAGLQACRRPEEKILTYTKRPEDVIPGKAQFYATAMPFAGGAIGLLVESHEGRPTKIEGNPQHPDSLGAANVFAQASVLDLYDPSRSRSPSNQGVKKSWSAARAFLRARGEAAGSKNGKGLAVLVSDDRSPTTQALIKKLRNQWPDAKIATWSPIDRTSFTDGTRLAFGLQYEPIIELAQAQVILTLDDDLFIDDARALRHTRHFADGRRVAEAGDSMNRLYSVESAFTLTGAAADHRLKLTSRDVGVFAAQLARELAETHNLSIDANVLAALPKKTAAPATWVKAVAKDLANNRRKSIVTAGAQQPAAVHALVALINDALRNNGTTVRYVESFEGDLHGPSALVDLTQAMAGGNIETLVILGGNPVFDAPADTKFVEALTKVANSVHLSPYEDETSKACTWHINAAHSLESWSDVRALDGTASIVQPLIAPLHDGVTAAVVVEQLMGGERTAYELVQAHWQGETGAAGFASLWQRALHDGVIASSASPLKAPTPAPSETLAGLVGQIGQGDGLELVFRPDSHAWDGRYANNGWLQEMPDPMSKITWGNGALISPATATELGLRDGDLIEVSAGGRSVQTAAVVQPGQADGSVNLTLGLGREFNGQLGDAKKLSTNFGFDHYPLRTSTAMWIVGSASIKKVGGTEALARTQEHHSMAPPNLGGIQLPARPLVREATLVQFKSRPNFAQEMVKYPKHPKTGKSFNLFGDFEGHEYNGHKWGMVIDLNACTGCNACMIACQSENNIPIVGKEGVIRGREMHWIRVDRYYTGEDTNNPQAVMQPVGCMHCENAPCELVCPVVATSHSTEGLNEMTYNRCVGTRYCANNCPYKVRRFNHFNYAQDVPELRKMQFNPDVTVRARGVMEKCTYCVQRIQEAKIARRREAAREGSSDIRVADGAVVSACAQSCPANAISFGDLNDEKSKVAKDAANPRAYGLLEELNTRPRTSFLARVRNPNPELEAA